MHNLPTLIAYAHKCLQPIPHSSKKPQKFPFRDRYHHTLRVMGWCERLLGQVPAQENIVLAAAALHDIGYAVSAEDHAAHGAQMAEAFLRSQGFEVSFVANVADLIARHSDKQLPIDKMSNELIVLQDADCLDEIGAMTVLWDALAEGALEEQGYEKACLRIEESYRRLRTRGRVLKSSYGQQLYLERFGVLRKFIEQAKYELFMPPHAAACIAESLPGAVGASAVLPRKE